MEKETFFNPFLNGNTPLFGNFFWCHGKLPFDDYDCIKSYRPMWLPPHFQSVQFITLDIILLIIAILVLNQVHGIKLFMAGVPNRIV